TVREQNRQHGTAFEVREVRKDEVDAEVLVAREREPRVDNDDVVAELVHGHVLADLAETAQRDDAEGVVAHAWESTGAVGATFLSPSNITRRSRGSGVQAARDSCGSARARRRSPRRGE